MWIISPRHHSVLQDNQQHYLYSSKFCFTLANLNADYVVVPAFTTATTFTNFTTTDNEFHDRKRGFWFVHENSHVVMFYLHALQYLMQRSWVGFSKIMSMFLFSRTSQQPLMRSWNSLSMVAKLVNVIAVAIAGT